MGNNFFVSNNAFVENNDIWMLTNKTNTLCHFSFPDMKFLAHYELPTERIIEYGYLSIAKIQQFIYVIPFVWEDIYKVDTETGKTICIKVPYLDGDNGKYGKFKIVCSYGDKLLLIGHAVKGLFIVDNNGIRIKTDLYDTLEKMGIYSTTEDIWFSDCHVVIDNVIYVPVFHSGYIVSIDIDTEEFEIYQINKNVRIRTIDVVDKEKRVFFFTTMNDEMIVWSVDDGIVESRKLNLLDSSEKYYMNALFVENKMYYIAACERKVFVEKDQEVNVIPFDYPEEDALPEPNQQFTATFRTEKDIYFQVRSNGALFRIDTLKDTITQVEFDIDESDKKIMIEKAFEGKRIDRIIEEKSWFTLNNYINIITEINSMIAR